MSESIISQIRDLLVSDFIECDAVSNLHADHQDYLEAPNLVGIDGLKERYKESLEWVFDDELIQKIVNLVKVEGLGN